MWNLIFLISWASKRVGDLGKPLALGKELHQNNGLCFGPRALQLSPQPGSYLHLSLKRYLLSFGPIWPSAERSYRLRKKEAKALCSRCHCFTFSETMTFIGWILVSASEIPSAFLIGNYPTWKCTLLSLCESIIHSTSPQSFHIN